MDTELELKKHGDNIDVSTRGGSNKKRRSTIYTNILNPDANHIAQVLLDLEITTSLPIEKAVKIYLRRRENKDWLGF